jgi:hydroxyethylthiazole kinase-like uncharacterized protein yjeF
MIELLTSEEMNRAVRLAAGAGIAGMDLMEAAGTAVADVAAAMRPPGTAVAVLCGPGDNGGDGFVAARLLSVYGYQVRVSLLGERSRLRGDALRMAERWPGSVLSAAPPVLEGADLVIDALFGAGLSRPLAGDASTLVGAVNACGRPVLAIDLPSGINGTSGAVMGAAVKAARTVTFFRRKPGHLLLPGRLHCGLLTLADIGIPAAVLDDLRPQAFVNGPDLWGEHFPIPRLDGHKYSRGHAVVVSGGMSFTGAARLAARGALRAGAGLVTIASPPDALPVQAAANLAVMVRGVGGADALTDLLADTRLNAVALGPALAVGGQTRESVLATLDGKRAVVLDADALTSFADDLPALVRATRGRQAPTVLTPHQGEFMRLFKTEPQITDPASKLEQARTAARHLDAVLLYKGPDTVIAAPDGRAAISDNAPPWLATAGSGDVLAGMIAGLLAQGMPAFEAAAAAAWLHGEAATAFGPGLISEDIPEALPAVYRTLFARFDK